MSFINSKEDLINYFKEGCKTKEQLSVGVEHEKFLFDYNSNQRVNFETISKVFNFLEKFGWRPIKEKKDVIALKRKDQNLRTSFSDLFFCKLLLIHLKIYRIHCKLNE